MYTLRRINTKPIDVEPVIEPVPQVAQRAIPRYLIWTSQNLLRVFTNGISRDALQVISIFPDTENPCMLMNYMNDSLQHTVDTGHNIQRYDNLNYVQPCTHRHILAVGLDIDEA